MPFVSSTTEFSDSQGVMKHRFRFWPLWRFRRFEDGSTHLRLLSLLWFNDESGFERHYSPLWTIWEHATDPEGCSHSSALWGLYRRTQTPMRSETHVPLLFSSMRDTEQDLEETKILGGLYGSKKEGDKRRRQFLYLISTP